MSWKTTYKGYKCEVERLRPYEGSLLIYKDRELLYDNLVYMRFDGVFGADKQSVGDWMYEIKEFVKDHECQTNSTNHAS